MCVCVRACVCVSVCVCVCVCVCVRGGEFSCPPLQIRPCVPLPLSLLLLLSLLLQCTVHGDLVNISTEVNKQNGFIKICVEKNICGALVVSPPGPSPHRLISPLQRPLTALWPGCPGASRGCPAETPRGARRFRENVATTAELMLQCTRIILNKYVSQIHVSKIRSEGLFPLASPQHRCHRCPG